MVFSSFTSFAVATFLVALCIGLAFGGHPKALPGVLRDIFVSDDVATQAQLIDDVRDNFYKPVKQSKRKKGE